MPKLERKLLNAVARRLPIILFGVAVAFSLYARFKLLPVIGTDMRDALLPWSERMANEGWAAYIASKDIWYSVPLQLTVWFALHLPIDTATGIKLFSIAGDYALALGAALIVLQLRPKDGGRVRVRLAMLAFAGVALLPLPLLNSAFWGQSDGLYALPLVFAVWFLLRGRWAPAVLLLGAGLAVKPQAIFLFPLFVMLYVLWRKGSALWFLSVPAVVFAGSLPGVLAGAPLQLAWNAYLYLGRINRFYYVNYPNASALSRTWFGDVFFEPAVGFTLVVLAAMLVWLHAKRRRVQGENTVLLGAWCVLACVYFLPAMHERYAYLGELLLWIWFFVRPGLRRFALAGLFTFTGYCAYANFLLGLVILPFEVLAMVNLAGLALLTLQLAGALPAKPLRRALQNAPDGGLD